MTARAWHSNPKSSAYGFADEEEYSPNWELSPGERVCPPFARSRTKRMLRGILFLMIVLGGSWALVGDRGTWSEWLQFASAAVFPSIDNAEPGPVEQPAAATAAPKFAEPLQQAALEPRPAILPPESPGNAAASSEAATPVETPSTTATLTDENAEVDEPANAPLPPPTADPDDPYETRALAVGLHPGLSRVLLEQLSVTDYRNAGIAIRTAIAETPDTGNFIYPRQRKPELALFRVHFVPGAAPNCRRYVVTVAKSGWSTTALPMEKCGPQISRRRT